jgi:hypothetical protein
MYGSAWFTITVTNTGSVPLTAVQVRNPQSPACDRRFARLASGASRSYRCWSLVSRDQHANLSVASGKPRSGVRVKAVAVAAVVVKTKTTNTSEVHLAG